ncbi:glycoside hydrolase family 39 [Fusarium beomiforme]|uniref:Glycoside hydrolase family 39 n=1 Tax=Fusarium beomiforme TaxID=44412 RepID=A0A9P5DZU9_9HYPO|nr:glycoside hydrolase family 39 [Fusarium beomiforme]
MLPQLVLSSAIEPRQSSSNTATVDLSKGRGSPQHLASGFIYGIPDVGFGQSPDQIPDHFYSDMGFNYARAGGAQISEGGWIYGLNAYKARLESTKQNYETSRKFGARFQILPHDIWGTDHTNQSSVWPGDNGDWTDYDNFLDQLLGDLQANDMLEGLDFDIWNERHRPDGDWFWNRSQDQYLQLWNRTYHRIRSLLSIASAFDNVNLVGPSSSSQPSTSNNWWVAFVKYVVDNNVVPDQWTWHDEPGDAANDYNNWGALRQQYNAPDSQVNINEYAVFDEQRATGAAWWISRLERYDYIGLRGNWIMGCGLHDFMASLLGKSDTNSCTAGGYVPNGEFQVYKYYNLNMTGTRATTTGSGDGTLDIYTTIGSDKVRVLTGVNGKTGTWFITIDNLSSVGLPTSGNLPIHTWGFIDNGHYGEVSAPTDRGTYVHQYSGDSVTFPIYQTNEDENTAWAFEFAVGPLDLEAI